MIFATKSVFLQKMPYFHKTADFLGLKTLNGVECH